MTGPITVDANQGAPCRPGQLTLPLPQPATSRFSIRLHPDYESIRDECDQWALSFFDPSSAHSIRQTYLRSLYPFLCAMFFHCAITRERLVLATNCIVWFFLFDDTLDEAMEQNADNVIDSLAAVLTTPSSSGFGGASAMGNDLDKSIDERLLVLAERFRVEVWEKMSKGMSPSYQRRLVGELMRSIKAMKEMWRIRKGGSGRRRTWEEMMELRMADGGGWVVVVMLEYTLGLELPGTGARELPGTMGKLMYELAEEAAKYIVMVNDMFSCGKELAVMDAQSMVGWLALQQQEEDGDGKTSTGCQLTGELLPGSNDDTIYVQQALCKMWDIVQGHERACAELLLQIQTLAHDQEGKPCYAQCLLYAEALCSALAGDAYWNATTWRYHGAHPVAWNTFPCYLTIPSEPIPALNVLYPRH
ncbi:hypothetical protein L7F22_062088 [Adiantum nelumboides]|nr:hypothetical protein [Adiantum nelumboides]